MEQAKVVAKLEQLMADAQGLLKAYEEQGAYVQTETRIALARVGSNKVFNLYLEEQVKPQHDYEFLLREYADVKEGVPGNAGPVMFGLEQASDKQVRGCVQGLDYGAKPDNRQHIGFCVCNAGASPKSSVSLGKEGYLSFSYQGRGVPKVVYNLPKGEAPWKNQYLEVDGIEAAMLPLNLQDYELLENEADSLIAKAERVLDAVRDSRRSGGL